MFHQNSLVYGIYFQCAVVTEWLGCEPMLTKWSRSSLMSCLIPSVLQSLALELLHLGDQKVALLTLNTEKL